MDSKANLNNNDMNANEVKEKCSEKCITNDMNIKIDDNPSDTDAGNEANGAVNEKTDENEDNKKANKMKSYDFLCTIFYSMVALLVFSTLSRTYAIHSGSCYGTLYGVQSMLAYTSVGLAVSIIRALRKQIKEHETPVEETDDDMKSEEDKDPKTCLSGYQKFENSPSIETPDLPPDYDSTDEKLRYQPELKPKTISYSVDRPYSGFDSNKLSSSILPLPLLPPPQSLHKRQTAAQNVTQNEDQKEKSNVDPNEKPNDLSVLSAADLKTMDTKELMAKQMSYESNAMNELDSVVTNYESNETKFEFKGPEEDHVYRINDYWNDYNLNDFKNKF